MHLEAQSWDYGSEGFSCRELFGFNRMLEFIEFIAVGVCRCVLTSCVPCRKRVYVGNDLWRHVW